MSENLKKLLASGATAHQISDFVQLLQFHVNTEHPEDADRLQDKMHWQRYSGMSNRDTAGSSFGDCPLCAKNMPLACVQFHITEEHPEIDISDSDSDISFSGDSADDSE